MLRKLLGICFFSTIIFYGAENQEPQPGFTNIILSADGTATKFIRLYGHEFEIKDERMENEFIQWPQLLKLVPEVFPDWQKKTFSKAELVDQLNVVVMQEMKVFSKAVQELAIAITVRMPELEQELLEMEIADYLVVNQAKELAIRYQSLEPSITPEIMHAQTLHNRYLLAMKISTLVKNNK